MNAEIVAIGSELLLGQIIDSNSAWISKRLAENGINLFYKTIVGDNPERMDYILSKSLSRADIVITCGGIGPTKDDITRDIVAKVTSILGSLDLAVGEWARRPVSHSPH